MVWESRLFRFVFVFGAPFFKAFGYFLFVALVAGSVELFVFYRIRQVLLFYVMSFVVVGIFITLAVADVFHHRSNRMCAGTGSLEPFLISSSMAEYAVYSELLLGAVAR